MKIKTDEPVGFVMVYDGDIAGMQATIDLANTS